MPSKDPLDRPITLRDIAEARAALRAAGKLDSVRNVLDRIEATAVEPPRTDFIRVRFGTTTFTTCRVASQPARRVQVGDLVTVRRPDFNSVVRVVRVLAADVTPPGVLASIPLAVAISPEDAKRIEDVIGPVR
jgi:hypothetical protein